MKKIDIIRAIVHLHGMRILNEEGSFYLIEAVIKNKKYQGLFKD